MLFRLRSWFRRRWRWLGASHEQVKIVFAIVAALAFLFEYQQNETQQRVARTLDYAKDYRTGEIAKVHAKLANYWAPHGAENLQSDIAKGRSYEEVLVEIVKRERFEGDINQVNRFYQEVSNCVAGALCDAPSACRMFFDDVLAFRETYRPFHQKVSSAFGEDVTAATGSFLKVQCKVQLTAYCKTNARSVDCRSSRT